MQDFLSSNRFVSKRYDSRSRCFRSFGIWRITFSDGSVVWSDPFTSYPPSSISQDESNAKLVKSTNSTGKQSWSVKNLSYYHFHPRGTPPLSQSDFERPRLGCIPEISTDISFTMNAAIGFGIESRQPSSKLNKYDFLFEFSRNLSPLDKK